MTRIIWFFYNYYFNPPFSARHFYCKKVVKKCGKSLQINNGSVISSSQNIVILNGVNIGSRAVIGVWLVFTKDILDYAVVAGSPARVIKSRKYSICPL